MSVVVVTDASSRLPAELLEKWAIRVVPLHILLDGDDLRDGVDEIPDDVYKLHATTAAATPAELADVYQEALADSGGDGVVAVHISSALSGTCGAAERTAADLDPAVRVIDSRSAAMGTGFVACWPPHGPRPPAATWTLSRTLRVRPCPAVTRSWWCTGWTICAAADGSVAPRRGSAPRWRSSRCCASRTANLFWPNGCGPSATRRRR